MTFGEKVKELRQQNALSQRQLAEKLDITLRTVRGWELEGRIPKQPQVYQHLAALFGCSVHYFRSDQCDNPSGATLAPADLTPSQILESTKTLFYEQLLSKQQQQEFIQEIEHIYHTSWEDIS